MVTVQSPLFEGLVQPYPNQYDIKLKSMEALKASEKISGTTSIEYVKKMNIIRFVSMCSIVWGHCLFDIQNKTFTTFNGKLMQVFLLEAGRLGTVCFFVISGFFLAHKLPVFTVLSYLRHRFNKIILPWVGFLILFVVIQLFSTVPLEHLLNKKTEVALIILSLLKNMMVYTSYWFVPIAIIAACVIIVFKKQVNTLGFGLILGCITLFYCVNLYYGWISVMHTKAILGYVFFLWLGIQLYRYQDVFASFINKIPWAILLASMAVLFLLACTEAIKLKAAHSADPFASIRFSNILLSLNLFIILLKTKRLDPINSLQPQRYVYGIYLIHSCLVSLFMKELIEVTQQASLTMIFIIQFIFFILIFLLSYFLVLIVKNRNVFYNRKPNSIVN